MIIKNKSITSHKINKINFKFQHLNHLVLITHKSLIQAEIKCNHNTATTLKALFPSHSLKKIPTDSLSYPSDTMISGKCIRTSKLLSGLLKKLILPKIPRTGKSSPPMKSTSSNTS